MQIQNLIEIFPENLQHLFNKTKLDKHSDDPDQDYVNHLAQIKYSTNLKNVRFDLLNHVSESPFPVENHMFLPGTSKLLAVNFTHLGTISSYQTMSSEILASKIKLKKVFTDDEFSSSTDHIELRTSQLIVDLNKLERLILNSKRVPCLITFQTSNKSISTLNCKRPSKWKIARFLHSILQTLELFWMILLRYL
ncbi:hypothetical protein GJ496_010661 [Pomphorhynchus laevis]|nr:hypothetical protein GJ496_010661 [Pomphorhynchus laevis]